jgi:hypothetical protein
MAVLASNGLMSDHAIGLVAVSSWQGGLTHQPRRTDTEQPGYGVSNLTRFASTFSWWAPQAAFGYTYNGHTALVVRRSGTITQVVGFNPDSFLYAGFLQMTRGNDITVKGRWYDDRAMIQDPTAVSYEINVSAAQAEAFGDRIAALVGRSDLGTEGPGADQTEFFYSFRPANVEPRVSGIVGNCGNMALLLLCQYLQEYGKGNYTALLVDWVNQSQATRNFGQGPMMGAVSRGFGAAPSESGVGKA